MTNLPPVPNENNLNPAELMGDIRQPKPPRLKLWILLFAAFYILTAVPAGFVVYTIKNNAGINIFKKGGGHAFAHCIEQAFNPKNLNISK
ncbi:MAG: hypothetical protein DI628_00620 [Blastochloris viridis]|uniref:Uncharacterized protein n=1 Tax=Blastochloris viridis TaxID=1079 RepID=A0A6N4R1M3_BLAVI|nr:MAG: hypothetical protein DI628_00620 [Blastochloris viridis]